MAGQKSHKRTTDETRSRRARREERGKLREQAQQRCAQANLQVRKLTARDIQDMLARQERGEVYRTIGKAYGLDEFTAARAVRYGRQSPWQQAEAKRRAERRPQQEAWAKRHGGKGQEEASS